MRLDSNTRQVSRLATFIVGADLCRDRPSPFKHHSSQKPNSSSSTCNALDEIAASATRNPAQQATQARSQLRTCSHKFLLAIQTTNQRVTLRSLQTISHGTIRVQLIKTSQQHTLLHAPKKSCCSSHASRWPAAAAAGEEASASGVALLVNVQVMHILAVNTQLGNAPKVDPVPHILHCMAHVAHIPAHPH